MKLKVEELTQNAINDTEKIKLIYKWVQSNIKYIAFEDGLGGFIPRAAGDVFAKKYGDCKDMANLLKTMINLADIPAYLALTGTLSIPYLFSDVPGANVANHVICAINFHDNYFFLDATDPFLEFGIFPLSIQGKEVLVILNDDEYKIIKIPVADFNKNTRKDSLVLKINGEILEGIAQVELVGYNKEFYHFYELNSKIKNKTNFLQNYLSIGKNSSAYKNTQVEVDESKITVNFDADFKNDIVVIGEKLYVNLNLDPSFEELKINDIEYRTIPIFEQYKNKYLYECYFQIPEGYSLEYIPENSSFEFDNFQIKTTYSKSEDKIIYQKEIISDFLFLYKNRFPEYKAFLERILKINEQKIILKKTI